MTGYLDSSVLLRHLLGQPGKLAELARLKRPISSKLLKAECLRSLDRFRMAGHLDERELIQATQDLYSVLDSVELVEISGKVLDRAGGSFPVALGTLDAIHLSSALVWREHGARELEFLTHDEALGSAARAMGFRVLGCG